MTLLIALSVVASVLSAVEASRLKCYTCWSVNPGSCTEVWICPHHYEYCGTTIVAENLITQQCMRRDMCDQVYSESVRCCTGDLCNGAEHAKLYVPLLPLLLISTWFM